MCRIHYPNSGVTQIKRVVSHTDYLKIKSTNNDELYKRLLKLLSEGDEWFTEKSPLWINREVGEYMTNNNTFKVVFQLTVM